MDSVNLDHARLKNAALVKDKKFVRLTERKPLTKFQVVIYNNQCESPWTFCLYYNLSN